MFTKQDKEDVRGIVVDVIKDVLFPALDNFATKEELREVKTLVENVYGELKDKRDEQSIHAQRHDDMEAQLRTHDKRIKTLEESIISPH